MFKTHKTQRGLRATVLTGIAGAIALFAAACSGPATGLSEAPVADAVDAVESGRQLSVVTAFYPLEFVASEVAGDRANVINLTPPAADPHDLELSIAAANQINTADLVVTLGGFQPAVDQAIEARNPARLVDAADYVDLLPAGEDADHDHDHDHADDSHSHDTEADEEADDHTHDHADDEVTEATDSHDHSHDDESDDHTHDEESEAGGHSHSHNHSIGGYDPHFWLDPIRLASLAQPVADALSEADPASADYFQANAASLVERLEELDAEFSAGLAPLAGAKLVTSHEAFAYLAHRYGLSQVGIAGIDPDIEPSPARLREIADIVRENNVNTIFYETLLSPRVVQTLANDIGVNAAVLHTAEGLTQAEQAAGDDYFTIMRANLETLKEHLQ